MRTSPRRSQPCPGDRATCTWVGAAEALGGFEKDRFGDTGSVAVDVTVPEADDRPALVFMKTRAVRVSLGLCMLAAIQLDDELGLAASEIGIVRFDR